MRMIHGFLFSLVATLGACKTPSPSHLELGNWTPSNHQVLDGWLDSLAKRSVSGRRVAVFDFDNTCIFGDVGEAIFRYQLEKLEIRLPPEELGALIAKTRRPRILAAYRKLWPAIRENKAVDPAAHRDFRTLMFSYFEHAYATKSLGPDVAFPFLAQLLAGYTEKEIDTLTAAALEVELAMKPSRKTWRTAADDVAAEFTVGIRAQPELIDLMAALKKARVRPFIVSASAEPVVEAAAAKLGYPVAPEDIYGIRVEIEDGKLTTRVPRHYPVTYRKGKVELIRKFIVDEPLLVAGDTFTDFEMLVAFPATEIALVINRRKDREMVFLYKVARLGDDSIPGPGDIRVLLQGRDENRCLLVPTSETTTLLSGNN